MASGWRSQISNMRMMMQKTKTLMLTTPQASQMVMMTTYRQCLSRAPQPKRMMCQTKRMMPQQEPQAQNNRQQQQQQDMSHHLSSQPPEKTAIQTKRYHLSPLPPKSHLSLQLKTSPHCPSPRAGIHIAITYWAEGNVYSYRLMSRPEESTAAFFSCPPRFSA